LIIPKPDANPIRASRTWVGPAGVSVLLGTGGTDPAASRDLPLLAALAIGNGLDRVKALEALTIGAARAFDASDRLGTIEAGKDAEILVLDGEPLTSTATVRYVVSGGRVVVQPGS
jgi:imidazolonepropionase-like amidohydrolase